MKKTKAIIYNIVMVLTCFITVEIVSFFRFNFVSKFFKFYLIFFFIVTLGHILLKSKSAIYTSASFYPIHEKKLMKFNLVLSVISLIFCTVIYFFVYS